MAGRGAASKESATPTADPTAVPAPAVPAPATQDTGLILTESATPQDTQIEIKFSRGGTSNDGPTGGGESGRMVPFPSGGGGEGWIDLYGCACVPDGADLYDDDDLEEC